MEKIMVAKLSDQRWRTNKFLKVADQRKAEALILNSGLQKTKRVPTFAYY
jgi:hypothetical protein